MDTSDNRAGAVLSQRNEGDKRQHPRAFLSKWFSTAELNYDVGNRELLAVKWAHEMWRYCLECFTHSFMIWMDHNNLLSIQEAKRLNRSNQDLNVHIRSSCFTRIA